MSGLRDQNLLAVPVLGSVISAGDKIRKKGRERKRESALSEMEQLTAGLDHPAIEDCFPHSANGLLTKQTEQLAPAHTMSLTFLVKKRSLIPNL